MENHMKNINKKISLKSTFQNFYFLTAMSLGIVTGTEALAQRSVGGSLEASVSSSRNLSRVSGSFIRLVMCGAVDSSQGQVIKAVLANSALGINQVAMTQNSSGAISIANAKVIDVRGSAINELTILNVVDEGQDPTQNNLGCKIYKFTGSSGTNLEASVAPSGAEL